MLDNGYLLALSVVLFFLLAVLLLIENNLERRIILSGFRGFLDRVILKVTGYISHWLGYLGRYVIKLSLLYGIHRFLRLILTFLVKTYDRLETVFLRNRDQAKVIKTEKKKIRKTGHLNKIVEHKASTALTENQKKKLLAKKLEKD